MISHLGQDSLVFAWLIKQCEECDNSHEPRATRVNTYREKLLEAYHYGKSGLLPEGLILKMREQP